MRIQINQELSIDTNIPFQMIETFCLDWKINEHSWLQLTGILNPEKSEYKPTDNEKIQIFYYDEIIYTGFVKSEEHFFKGVTVITIRAVSASIHLDSKKYYYVWQNVDKAYGSIVEELVMENGGDVISTVSNKRINKPVICYAETIWEFIKRLASCQNTCILVDIVTGKPNVWFGIKHGDKREYSEVDQPVTINIEKYYNRASKTSHIKTVTIESTRSYSIGDHLTISDESLFVIAKNVLFQHGSLRFQYKLVNHLDIERIYNNRFTGLCLEGIVKKTINEQIKVGFDMDGDDGDYYYPWMPEVGNGFYLMPEVGAKVDIYFRNHDEAEGVAVRCKTYSTAESNVRNKVNRTPKDGFIQLNPTKMYVKKGSGILTMSDKTNVGLSANHIEISGKGKVKFNAPQIRLTSKTEIKAISK